MSNVSTSTVQRHRQLDLFELPRAPHKPLMTAERLTGIALGIFHASGPVEGTLGARFFEMRRLEVPDQSVVRFHPSLKFGDTRAPGLIFLLRDVRTGEPTGVVRLFLDTNGWVVGKRALGRVWGATLNRAPRPP
jgi:hypothetical protein